MVRNNGSQLRDSRFILSESALSAQLGEALRDELGATRRVTKTAMRWTGVSDTTARSWLQGSVAPNGSHLLALAGSSQRVMAMLLHLTGHGELELGLNLQEIESDLILALAHVRAIVKSPA